MCLVGKVEGLALRHCNRCAFKSGAHETVMFLIRPITERFRYKGVSLH